MTSGAGSGGGGISACPAKDQTRMTIERMEAERQARRKAMSDRRVERAEEEQRNLAAGNPGDVDFIGLVRKWREAHVGPKQSRPQPRTDRHPKICICVRKRPVTDKERKKHDHDSVTVLTPDSACIHSCKLRVDGITKYIDHSTFRFDYAFDETEDTEAVYVNAALPLIHFICEGKGGRATVFAYGQTGSGKTYTMGGIQSMAVSDLFSLLESNENASCNSDNTFITVSFFELYGGRIQDLLNNREKLKLLEDAKGEIVVTGLEEFEANDTAELMELIDTGNKNRTTHATEANDTSSRSHAVCQIVLRDKSSSKLRGKLSLVDLAGSERGSDTKSHNRQRRTESSEINKSLLALKECIRALDSNGRGNSTHVPYRASKLTLILKDCFTSNMAKSTMITTVSPGASSADHTLNSLRYADRIKEKKVKPAEKIDSSLKSPSSKQPTGARSKSPTRPSRKEETNSKNHIENSREKDSVDDLEILHASLRGQRGEIASVENDDVAELHRTVAHILDEEECLLNMHMMSIQENAELLTEEGRLLNSVSSDQIVDYDIDAYASRLSEILDRKSQLIYALKEKMDYFKSQLKKEEELSRKVPALPGF
eukprot:CAMPEP_0194378562 /NCGR_PEP_ID=MMETSP0174-20130528/36125_1 /TAXON_ID=216777 /ORGANISM="Proboscia alata, Strain PI-D3" /LENGTH=599 /DNA_ID=CAMNT_0039160689 /DNA_START=174 /DNA_END=1973 /DNA_ORIENTATION=+